MGTRFHLTTDTLKPEIISSRARQLVHITTEYQKFLKRSSFFRRNL